MDYAAAEKQAAKKIDLRHYRWFMLASLIAFVLGLLLSHSGDVRGLDVLLQNQRAEQGDVRIAETIFVLFGTTAAVVLNAIVLITRRTAVANIQYLIGGIALLFSLFALWMRLQSKEIDGSTGIGIGLMLEVVAIIVLIYAMSCVIFARSEEQRTAAAMRAEHNELDSVGLAQQESMRSRGVDPAESNPLLIDDRRKRAAEKHQRSAED
ncbi:Rv2732c family membrane protein [Corynebacterium pseudopelargi]|uniref:Uncharacterized protein n=1 Tax=Corynebacterium pseudopelargi TaxID=2080757 RepID=A0A3G6ITN2_9CORY|nr:hypothetical protein [Corynebacterium pseudopelargi]AZA09091.1 hypothetical protein CPPEL_04820 [Corynebacterium pseudopelargi]